MNAKKCKKYRKLARLIAGDKQETTYQLMQISLDQMNWRGKLRWKSKGWAPMVWVSPDCARGIYHQMKGDM